MVLWKKESASSDACYNDLISSGTAQYQAQYQFLKSLSAAKNKNDGKSTVLREHGNQQFKAKNWCEAMELYNQSLRYAIDGSENISLAYANRSLCFFKMQKYDHCLADIALAKKANYPKRLMAKLKEREAACLKLISEESPKSLEKAKPMLSFDAHEKYPCMANVLEIRNNDNLGKHIVAKCDIDVGQIVLVEDMFASHSDSKRKTFCKTCLKSMMNFIPCRNCGEVMFCDDDHCMASNTIHAMSCNPLRGQIHDYVPIVESILIAVTAFPNVISLMEFVEHALATPDFDTPKCDSDMQTKYNMFLKLRFANTDDTLDQPQILYWLFQFLWEIPEIQQRFQSTQAKRFLMHLTLQHINILRKNTTTFGYIGPEAEILCKKITGICPFKLLLKTSCIRNVSVKQYGNQVFVYAVRPITADEQLFIENDAPAAADQQCKCSKCVSRWKLEDQIRFESEEEYQFLKRCSVNDFEDPVKRPILKEKLKNLLVKYGRSPWSPTIESALVSFDNCMRNEFCI